MLPHLFIKLICKENEQRLFSPLQAVLSTFCQVELASSYEEASEQTQSSGQVIFYVSSPEMVVQDITNASFDGSDFLIIDENRQWSWGDPLNKSFIPQIQSYLNQYCELKLLQQDFLQLEDSLDQEMSRLQKWYRRLVPLREERFPNIYMAGKYKTGQQSGGDFYDLIKHESRLTIVFMSSSSYLLSSKVMEVIQETKDNSRGDSTAELDFVVERVSGLYQDFSSHGEKLSLDFFLATIDYKNLSCQGYLYGNIDTYSSDGRSIAKNDFPVSVAFKNQAYFEFKLKPAERFVISSEGLHKNWERRFTPKDFYQCLKSAKSSREALEEIFSKLHTEDDHSWDSSLVWLEVDQHGIYEV